MYLIVTLKYEPNYLGIVATRPVAINKSLLTLRSKSNRSRQVAFDIISFI